MKIRTNESRFSDLAKALEQVDDNGRHGECGSWGMSLGGYDTGYEISYDGETIGRVNYEDKEYELYRDDCVSKDEVPEFLSAIDADGFKDAAESVEVKEDWDEASDESVKHVLVKEDANDNTKSRTESLKLTADYFLGQLRGLVDKVSKEDSEGAKLFFKNANNTLKDLVRQFEDLKANF